MSSLQRELHAFDDALASHAHGVRACSQGMVEDTECVLEAGRFKDVDVLTLSVTQPFDGLRSNDGLVGYALHK